MKNFILSVFVIVAVAGLTSARPDEKYTTKFDNVNIDEILQSDRLLLRAKKCLAGEVTCPPDIAELKRVLPDALENNCAKCSEGQRKAAIKVIHYFIDNKREWWNELAAIYDPQGTYTKKYEEEAKKNNIKL